MLPRQNRLKKRKDFDNVFKKGRGFKDPFLFLKIAENNLENSRFGIVVNKKSYNKACLRNKIKRKLSEAISKKIKEIKKGFDVVIVASTGLEVKRLLEIEEIINKNLKKARLI